jgi:hypothetical protein
MPELPSPGQHHGHAAAVRRANHFVVPDRSSGLDDGRYAGLGSQLDAVRKGKEGVGGENAAGGIVALLPGFV